MFSEVGQPAQITLTGRDFESDVLVFEIVQAPAKGSIGGSSPNFTYTPASGYIGQDIFSYRAFDGHSYSNTAQVSVNFVAAGTPVARNQSIVMDENISIALILGVTDSDSSAFSYTITQAPTHGTLNGTAPNLTYTPVLDYFGEDAFSFRANDGVRDSNVALVSVQVLFRNNAPRVTNTMVSLDHDTTKTFSLPVTDPENDDLTYTVVKSPVHGDLSGVGPTSVRYQPNNGYLGFDSFSFKTNDGRLDSEVAVVTILVRESGIFNVKQFGARGDGASDDTEPIRAAIADASASGGGKIYFPRGTYNVAPRISDSSWSSASPYIFAIDGSDLTFEGDGRSSSVISCYTIGMEDPKTHWTIHDPDGYFKIKRGGAFRIVRDVENITFRNLRVTGNFGPATHDNTVGGNVSTGAGWDMSHKGFASWANIDNILFENTEWDSWSGEIIYTGGALGKRITIRDSLIHDSNASSISVGADLLIENSQIYDVYNATENMAEVPTQRTVIRNSTIDVNPRGLPVSGFGVVYLGYSQSSLLVEDSVIKNAPQAAIFISEFGSNVTIRRNVISDSLWGVYLYYMNMYKETPWNEVRIDNYLIEGNTFLAKNSNMGFAILVTFPFGADNWIIQGNQVLGENGYKVSKFIEDNIQYGPRTRSNYSIRNNTITDAFPMGGTGVRPLVWENNTLLGLYAKGESYNSLWIQYLWHTLSPHTTLLVLDGWTYQRPYGLAKRNLQLGGNLANYPEGYQVTLKGINNQEVWYGLDVPPNANWNSFQRGYVLADDASLTIKKGANGKFAAVSYTAPSGEPLTLTQNQPNSTYREKDNITFRGRTKVILTPTVPFTYSSFSGVPENVPVIIEYNSNTRIAHDIGVQVPALNAYNQPQSRAGVINVANGTDFVATRAGAMWAMNTGGTLKLFVGTDGKPIVEPPAPFPGTPKPPSMLRILGAR